MKRAQEKTKVQEYMDRLSIAASTMEKLARFLSGGTQQKVVIAKWLMSKSPVFIFDEPTRGIDVGPKQHLRVDGRAGFAGSCHSHGIFGFAGDALGMSDRIYVMSGGAA